VKIDIPDGVVEWTEFASVWSFFFAIFRKHGSIPSMNFWLLFENVVFVCIRVPKLSFSGGEGTDFCIASCWRFCGCVKVLYVRDPLAENVVKNLVWE
jgi:hypothetical protein